MALDLAGRPRAAGLECKGGHAHVSSVSWQRSVGLVGQAPRLLGCAINAELTPALALPTWKVKPRHEARPAHVASQPATLSSAGARASSPAPRNPALTSKGAAVEASVARV